MASTILDSISIETRAAIFSALGDPIRLQVLDALSLGERCVCDLQEIVAIAPNLLSYHLRVLREARLVETARRGRWVDYRLAAEVQPLLHGALPPGLAPDAAS